MEWIRFSLTAVLLLAGLVFCCIGVYGVNKFQYAANRMHAAAIVDTLGIALCLLGLAVSAPDLFSGLKIVLVLVFWWISSPVASHLLCRLEIMTDEQKNEYMTVHKRTLQQEREAAEAAVYAAAGIEPEDLAEEDKAEEIEPEAAENEAAELEETKTEETETKEEQA